MNKVFVTITFFIIAVMSLGFFYFFDFPLTTTEVRSDNENVIQKEITPSTGLVVHEGTQSIEYCGKQVEVPLIFINGKDVVRNIATIYQELDSQRCPILTPVEIIDCVWNPDSYCISLGPLEYSIYPPSMDIYTPGFDGDEFFGTLSR